MKYANYTAKEIALNIVNATNASPTNKLSAIKEYRHATGCNLGDAKEAINTAIENKVCIEWIDKLIASNHEASNLFEIIDYFEEIVYGT